MGDERRGAIALSGVAAAATAVTWALGWWSLPTEVRADGAPSVVLAALSPVAMSAVLLAAAWLLARGRVLAGAVVLWTVVVMMAPGLLLVPRQLIDARGAVTIGSGVLGMVGILAVVAAAFLVRRHLTWSALSRERTHVGVVVAGVLVTLGLILPKVVHHPAGGSLPGGEGMWRPMFLTAHGLVDVVVLLLGPSALLAVLVLAARIHPSYAGVVILAAIVPSLAGDLGTLGMAFEQADLRPTPVAWLSLAADLMLLALAVRWATGDRPVRRPSACREPSLSSVERAETTRPA